MVYKIKIGVMIDLKYMDAHILSGEYNIDLPDNKLKLRGGLFYNDSRVKKFLIYYQDNNKWYKLEFPAVKAIGDNLSYCLRDEIVLQNGKEIDVSSLANIGVDINHNRILVSEPYQERNYLGRKTLIVGGHDEEVLALESSALEIGTGQYGEYPLFAFCNKNIYAIAIDATGKLFSTSITPYSINDSIINNKCLLSYQRTIFYLSNRGLKLINDGRILSDIIQGEYGVDGIRFSDIMNDAKCVIYYKDIKSDREEIWIVFDNIIYAYSLKHNKWYTLEMRDDNGNSIEYNGFSYIDNILVCYTNDGKIYLINKGNNKLRGAIRTGAIHFGEPNIIKRLRYMIVNFLGDKFKIFEKYSTKYEYYYVNDCVDEYIININVSVEFRYQHRPKIKIKEIVKGYLSGYCGIYCNKYPY